ncbi:MAG: toxin-antitoxin system HicB family antitoxin [Trebonia sp.]
MSQLTIRSTGELADRVRTAAAEHGSSMNEYIVAVLDAATTPELAGSEADRVRERLRTAGLLVRVEGGRHARPAAAEVARARMAAGSGTALSDLVAENRR